MGSPPVWRISSRSGLRLRQLDEELLLFDPHSWRTHLLNATAAELVQLLQHARSAEDLAEALCPEDPVFLHELGSVLSELSELGLVERVEQAD